MNDVNDSANAPPIATNERQNARSKTASVRIQPRRHPWFSLALAATLGLAIVSGLALGARRDPLKRAWHSAERTAGYSVHGTTSVNTANAPTAFSVTGLGAATGELTLTLRPLNKDGAPSTELRIDWPTVTDGEGAAIAPRTLGALLPAGDPLALLASAHAGRAGPIETVNGTPCRRVDFLVGARAYATWWENGRRHLPVNATAGGLWRFEGSGTVWIDEATDRPCRIAAQVDLPRLVGDTPGQGRVDWRYVDWRD